MDTNKIDEAIRKSLLGEITFPNVVKALMEQGVESYHVDLIRGENRYYSHAAESHIISNHHVHTNAPEVFSSEQVIAAIRDSQQGKINYQTFVERIVQAGCVFYIAYLTGRRVVYFGRKGDFHTEHFPTSK